MVQKKFLIFLILFIALLFNAYNQVFTVEPKSNKLVQNSNLSKTSEDDISNKISSEIKIEDVWSRPSIGTNKNTAIYLKITNSSQKDIILRSVSAAEISDLVELHDSFIDEKGVSRMRKIDVLVIPSNYTVKLIPGGSHIMALNLKKKLKVGDEFDLVLNFDNFTISVKTFVKNFLVNKA